MECMRQIHFVSVLVLAAAMNGCSTMSSTFAGDPNKHGFVIFEGEVAISKIVSVEHPFEIMHGKSQAGLTWFTELEPGRYRVKDISLPGVTEPVLSFTIGAGELLYLGYIVATPLGPTSNSARTAPLYRFNIVHNRDELRAWEHVYNEYANTPWEGLLLKKIETVRKSGND